jgi:hypothetical protein
MGLHASFACGKPTPAAQLRILGGYAAENRGADFVQRLVLSPGNIRDVLNI